MSDPRPVHPFPEGFRWGVATASYQIEGATAEGGRGPSVWDDFCARPGNVKDGSSGRIACDHYHRYEADFDLMASLGIRHYRMSIAWPRLFPEGTGKPNPEGLAFYDRLVDAALARGIQPAITCFHWDLPSRLQERGGWLGRETPPAFAEYAAEAVRLLGDRVQTWYTLNEHTVVWHLGHVRGSHAPGLKLGRKDEYQVCHNLLLGHGLAVRAIRAAAPRPPRVGIVENSHTFEPAVDNSEEDIAAARSEFARINAWILDPLFHGRYPVEQLEALGPDAPECHEGDMEAIAEPLDVFGLNHYSTVGFVRAGDGVRPHREDFPRNDFNWPVAPQSLYWAIRFLGELYGPSPIEVTENGCCYPDQPDRDGVVLDTARIQMLRGAIGSLHRAISEGHPVEAYYLWSFLDNFEWAEGYTKRFGIVHVNYETLERIPKESARWYSNLIARNGF